MAFLHRQRLYEVFLIFFIYSFMYPISYSSEKFFSSGFLHLKDYQSRIDLDKDNLICKDFYSPFEERDRKSLKALEHRLTGSYAEYRRSYKPGHLHAGIDLKGAFDETIFAVGRGQVHLIFREFPHQSVVVKHLLSDGSLLYSVYTHVQDVRVQVGQQVSKDTPLARLFNRTELTQANFGTPNHLHLEIRKSFADRGRASYSSMTLDDLNTFCRDPLDFFKEYLKE
jgi:murein DD-endopeptidase MepM/ murein hydrolase activator NlpD